jgi:phage gp36-like protein
MAYATGSDLIQRFDIDLVADLATDSREPVDRNAVATLPQVLTALADAAGMIDVNITVGERYTPADLAALLADTSSNSRNHLISVNCDIAMAKLLQRRVDPALQDMTERLINAARTNLQSLARGENVFGIPANQGTGIVKFETISAVDIDRRNLVTTRMNRYFPTTDSVIPRQ